MDRGAGRTTVHGVERVGHELVTEAQGTITWAGALWQSQNEDGERKQSW